MLFNKCPSRDLTTATVNVAKFKNTHSNIATHISWLLCGAVSGEIFLFLLYLPNIAFYFLFS